MNYLFKRKHTKYADLHIHTDRSDGLLSPEQIVAKADKAGLSTISITDHDMLDGIEPALAAGKRHNVEIIPGLEISAEHDNDEIHILGYFIDWQNQALNERLQIFRNARHERALKMMDKLKQLGVHIDHNDVFRITELDYVGRPHLAAAIVQNGYAETISDAFNKFLGNNAPAYIPKSAFSSSEAIKMILDSDGIPVWGHPGTLKHDVLKELISYGLMGIEAYYSYHSNQLTDYYCNLSRENNLLITGGSDFHGFENSRRALGEIKLPYEYVEELKEAVINAKFKMQDQA
ncbi:MAG: PHP domain-containing protein [Candidatus Poribacteria bacterium]